MLLGPEALHRRVRVIATEMGAAVGDALVLVGVNDEFVVGYGQCLGPGPKR